MLGPSFGVGEGPAGGAPEPPFPTTKYMFFFNYFFADPYMATYI